MFVQWLSLRKCSLLEKGAIERVHPLVQFYSTYFLVLKKNPPQNSRLCKTMHFHVLSVSKLCLCWLPSGVTVILKPSPSCLSKVLLPQFINQSIALASIQTSTGLCLSAQILSRVCALRCYVETKLIMRHSDCAHSVCLHWSERPSEIY